MLTPLLSWNAGRKAGLSAVLAVAALVAAQAQTVVTIGTGTGAASTNALLSTSTTGNRFARTVSIYSAAELTAAGALPGNIVSIAWFKGGSGEYPTPTSQLSVYMKATTASVLSANPVVWDTEVVGATQVYSNQTLALPTGTGFKTFTLGTPFGWNGTSNVEVLVDWERAVAPTADITWQYTPVGTTGIHATQVNSVVIPTVRWAANRPNVQFGITPSGSPGCNAPTLVSAGSISSSSASISFTPSATASTYTVTYTAQGGMPQTVAGSPSSSPVALTGLQPNTQYSVSVVSNCPGGLTSAPATTTFTTPFAPCNAPTNLVATSQGSTALSVSFTAPTPAASAYTVTYGPTAGGSPQTLTPSPASSPFTITGLQPNTAYSVSVASNCPAGGTSTVVMTSATTAPLCLSPNNLTTSNVTGTTVQLNFTPAPGVAAGVTYLVSYTASGGPTQTVTPAPSSSPVILTGLQPSTTYTVSISTICSPTQTSTPPTTITLNTDIQLASRESRAAALVRLYPNPAHSSLTVTVPAELSTKPVSGVLLNALGQVVRPLLLPATAAGAQGQLEVSTLAVGLYTLRLELGATVVYKPLMVE
jgi:hypothetical protein